MTDIHVTNINVTNLDVGLTGQRCPANDRRRRTGLLGDCRPVWACGDAADPYLRFWLRFVEPGINDIQRGGPDLARARITMSWAQYRGRAVEPLVREALARLAASDPDLGGAETVGGWWPRGNIPEVDLVGVRHGDAGKAVSFIGSIKWREREPFTQADLDELLAVRPVVPGAAGAASVAVARTTCTAAGVAFYDPARLITAR